MRSTINILLLSVILCLGACKKGEGEGGKGTITGKVYVRDFNANFTLLNGEYDGMGEDVYLVYGDNETYNDKVETHYDGTFEFNWLRAGNYELYVYSKDTTLSEPSGIVPVIVEVKISGKDEVVDVGTLVIAD